MYAVLMFVCIYISRIQLYMYLQYRSYTVYHYSNVSYEGVIVKGRKRFHLGVLLHACEIQFAHQYHSQEASEMNPVKTIF